MKKVLRTVLAFTAGGAALLALEALWRRRGRRAGSAAARLVALVRPAPVPDDTVEVRVRRKLAHTARQPEAIHVSIEHGCVDLRGPVATRERARIVRAVATIPGVDSVLDLMTEPGSSEGAARF
jgi:hypothetical protein